MPDIPMEPEYQATNWEDVHLRGIFLECDTSTSSLSSSGSIAPKISVPVIIGYIGDNLPNTPDEFLLELRKSLESVSSNGFVNWRQFKEASRLWVARLKELRWQDGNNNMHKTDYANVLIGNLAKDTRISNRDYDHYEGSKDEVQNLPALRGLEDIDASTDFSNGSSPTMYDDITQSTMTDMTTGSSKEDTSGEVTEVELRLRVRRSYEENAALRDELVNAEELIISLRQQRDCLRRELEQAKKRCQQLERENDEQKEELNEMIEKQRICTLTLQKVEKQRDFIQEKLENAEIEIQSMPPMNEKLQKLEKEKLDYMRQIVKIESGLAEKQNECEALQTMLTQLQERTTTLQEVNDRTIQCLREQNQQLASENSELLAERSVLNGIGFEDRFSTSSVPSIGHCYAHSTPHKAPKLERQESLYDELKASGFGTECGGTTSRSEDLEEELNWYDEEICGMLETIETVINELAASKNKAYTPGLRSKKEELAKARAVETLKEKISLLQRMVAEVMTKNPAEDTSTQIAAEPMTTDILSQFGIQSFQDQLKFIWEDTGTNVVSLNRGVPDEPKEDPFLKTATTAVTAVQEDAIIGPIVAALDRIIRDTSSQQSSPTERSPSGNFRSRSIYTYTTCRPSEETTDNPADLTRGQLLAFGEGDCPSKKGTDEECENLRREVLQSSEPQKLEVVGEQDVESMAEDTKFVEENSQDLISESSCVVQQISSNEIENDVLVDNNESSSQLSTCNNDKDGKEGASDSEKIPVSPPKTLFDRQAIADTKILRKTFGGSKFSTYRDTLEPTLRTIPQRKISVFHRSFDVSMLENQVEEEKQAEMELTSFSSRSSFQEERKSEGPFDGSQLSGSSDPCRYTFSDSYRPRIDSSESSSSSPRKSDTSTSEDLSFIEDSRRAVPRTITLNPPRLTLPRVKEDVLPDEKGETSASSNSTGDCVKSSEPYQGKKIMSETVTISTGNSVNNSTDTRDSSSVDPNNYRYGNIDRRRTYSTADSNSSCSLLSPRDNENDKWVLSENEQPCNNKLTSETYVLSPRSALFDTNDHKRSEEYLAKVKDPGYSPPRERENSGSGDEPRAERAVALAMSSREESSDSECEPQPGETNETGARTIDSIPSSGLSSSTPYTTPRNSARRTSTEFSSANDDPLRSARTTGTNIADVKQTRSARQRILSIRRSLSDGESNDNGRKECRCRRSSAQEVLKSPAEPQQRVFPSLTDGYLQESGIANLSDTQVELNESLSEEELQEGIRQRNSVSGRVTLRRPSLCYETPKWENEKLDRSDRNSCSTGELRGIYEHAESRRNSREENNNILRVNQTVNHMNTTNSRTVDGQVWNICKGESLLEQPQPENIQNESRLCVRAHDSFRLANNLPWRPMLWCILIFFFGFYVNQAISSISGCRRAMYKWWSIEEILSHYIKVENAGPRPV